MSTTSCIFLLCLVLQKGEKEARKGSCDSFQRQVGTIFAKEKQTK